MTAIETYEYEETTTTTTTTTKRSRKLSVKSAFDASVAKFGAGKVAPIKISLDDIDDLILGLSPEEIEELGTVDPDDSSMPASMRCLYSCEKSSTGQLDRSAMLASLKETACVAPDQEERVPFVPGTLRGKKFVPKEGHVESTRTDSERSDALQPINLDGNPEYNAFFAEASFDDLREMADILGVTYQDDCLASKLKVYPEPAPNDTNVEQVIALVEQNNPECIEINFNNLKGISSGQWRRLFAALRSNTRVESLTAANCDIGDSVGALIRDCLKDNSALRLLTLDSNSLSGDMVVALIRASAHKKTLEELRCSNQLNCKYLGNRVETEIVGALKETPQLVKLGLTMEFRDTLNKAAVQLKNNLDRRRLQQDRSVTLKLDRKLGPRIVEGNS